MNLDFRKATESDVSKLVKLLPDDDLGATREDVSIPLNQGYIDAFHSIEKDPNNELTVVECNGELAVDLPLQVISTGLPYLIVPINSNLEHAQIVAQDFEAMLASVGAKFVYVFQ